MHWPWQSIRMQAWLLPQSWTCRSLHLLSLTAPLVCRIGVCTPIQKIQLGFQMSSTGGFSWEFRFVMGVFSVGGCRWDKTLGDKDKLLATGRVFVHPILCEDATCRKLMEALHIVTYLAPDLADTLLMVCTPPIACRRCQDRRGILKHV